MKNPVSTAESKISKSPESQMLVVNANGKNYALTTRKGVSGQYVLSSGLKGKTLLTTSVSNFY